MRQEDPGVALAQSLLIARLPAELRGDCIAACKVRTYLPGERICLVGDSTIGPTWIERGLVKVFGTDGQGAPAAGGLFWGGDTLLASFRSEWTVVATAVAVTTLCAIRHPEFDRLCDTSAHMSHAWMRLAAEHSRALLRREAVLRFLALRPRLLLLLGMAADSLGTPLPEGILLDFPLTHATLSCGTWVSRDETGRALRDLEQQGYLLSRPRHRILIPDRERLNHDQHLRSEDAD